MPADRVRSTAVAVFAVVQVVSSPLTLAVLGPASQTGQISDANNTPVTPAGYAFAIWGLIYAASLALAVYQALPSQQTRAVHRRTGWWLVGAFAASAVWIPIFGTRAIWLSQVVILALVACLVVAAWRFSRLGPAGSAAEEWLLRVPVTLYLGWATLASVAGFGATFRSFGMPSRSPAVTAVSIGLVLLAALGSTIIVTRISATAGFAASACWALLAVAVATDATLVQIVALLAVVLILALVVVRAVRSSRPRTVLLG